MCDKKGTKMLKIDLIIVILINILMKSQLKNKMYCTVIV